MANGRRDCTAGRAFALHVADLVLFIATTWFPESCNIGSVTTYPGVITEHSWVLPLNQNITRESVRPYFICAALCACSVWMWEYLIHSPWELSQTGSKGYYRAVYVLGHWMHAPAYIHMGPLERGWKTCGLHQFTKYAQSLAELWANKTDFQMSIQIWEHRLNSGKVTQTTSSSKKFRDGFIFLSINFLYYITLKCLVSTVCCVLSKLELCLTQQFIFCASISST